ncbi:TetR/AcrR family transcriptional regulator [Defluviimonas sp. SAOS-178_SWC]|uniref:TetR/AcrR family transcriptional regulator n=1 Tax=Defluviimonas sp. SAOS-178_SWC TaxID=3121287 RepID=UPI0032221E9F
MSRAKPEPKFTRLTSEERRAGLIAAGLACMARGGIQEFTVDKICLEAGVSRGLITHHFGSMNGLLAAVYAAMYREETTLSHSTRPGEFRLSALLDAIFAPVAFNRERLTIWLTLWGQISINPELGNEHRAQYADYLDRVAAAIAEVAEARGLGMDSRPLAKTLICLIDGLGLQHCIDPETMPPDTAKAACRDLLERHLGAF